MEKNTEVIMKNLQEINWDFSDFSSFKYPYDLNSIPWYPATFISPIPRLLVASLSNPGEIVLDPFGGKGTTAIETALQNRIPMYCDLNPFAADNTKGLFAAIEYAIANDDSLSRDELEIRRRMPEESTIDEVLDRHEISLEVKDWFHVSTLKELLAIVEYIAEDEANTNRTQIRKLAFSAILKAASSQQGHFTYVTDNCKPVQKKEKKAIDLYCEKVNQVIKAAEEFVKQYKFTFPNGNLQNLLKKRKIVVGDSKDLSWCENDSVDLVITSPPYLCSQDYIKTMRLMNLFYQNRQAFEVDIKNEIGARATRGRKKDYVIPKFYSDMSEVFSHIQRVLKKEGFFCLVIGQGKSKITSENDIIKELSEMLQEEKGFTLLFNKERHIGSRVIQVGGVDKESVLIFQKNGVN